ncbi:ECF-type riboflavin transporter substrate-binding protein [uncultured Clostridium sp.]|uniref:ECF-type riboflavin transporter substrate-binding protein n=1 Tax=uncultured Clostridium sp. TaxID=59620 RepID=UPI0025CE5F56|nr:ECF-type riboflavin transporter substrate-binding protein [uncultured Clostridium sp.]
MNKGNLSIKTIVAIGIGSAVFMILGRFASIPTGIPNTEIQTAYAFLALMAVIYGPLAGVSIGLIGHTLKDLTAYGSPWFSWIIASGIVGLAIGLAWKKLNIDEGEFNKSKIIIFNVSQIIANIVAWNFVAPTLDIVIYAEPSDKVYSQGAVAGISNMITIGVLGTILLYLYSKTRVKKGSLMAEE